MTRTGAKRLPSVVVDTVILVRGLLSKRGNPYRLTLYWRAARFLVVTSHEQRSELLATLAKPRITRKYAVAETDRAALLWLLDNAASSARPLRRLPVDVRDPNDRHILGAALAADADYLITDDDDLLVLKDDPGLGTLRIVTVGEFLEILDADQEQ